MTDFPILTALIVTPFLGTVAVLLVPSRRPELVRIAAYAFAVATLALSLWLLANFETGHPGYQFTESERWIGDPEREGVLRVDAVPRGRADGRVPLARPRRLLRVLRVRARAHVLPDPGMGSRATYVRGPQVLHLHDGGLGVPPRRDPRARVPPCRCARQVAHVRPADPHRLGAGRSRHRYREVALPRVLRCVRGEGPAGADPHLASRRAH